MKKSFLRTIPVLLLTCILLVSAAPAAAQVSRDVVTVATVVTNTNTVAVPVYIRDLSGTPLGVDQPPGSRIQAYSIKVDYAPTPAVQSITFQRAGITAGLTPSFEASPSAPGSVTLINSFVEATNPIPFTLNAPAPGNQIGQLFVTLAPGVMPGTVISLTLDATLTQLSNQAGTTRETVTLGTLTLVNGSITVTAPATPAPAVPTLGQWGMILLALLLVAVAIRHI
jgi:hypothetical protein